MNVIDSAMKRRISVKEYNEIMKNCREIPLKTSSVYMYPHNSYMTETPPCRVLIYDGDHLEEFCSSNDTYYLEIYNILKEYSEKIHFGNLIFGQEGYVWLRTSDGWKKIDRKMYYNNVEEFYETYTIGDSQYEYILQAFGYDK